MPRRPSGVLPSLIMIKILKSKIGTAVLGICLLAFAGCASFNANTFNAETLAADTATTATHAFNQYYQSSTNGATETGIAKLNGYRDEIYSADVDLSKALAVLDKARLDYAGNAAATNKTAVLAALQTVSDQSSNIVSLASAFIVVPPKN